MQNVLALQTPVQAEPWLHPRMAPSTSGAKVSINSRVRQRIGCQTSAFFVALDALFRASLPARLAFAERPYFHSSTDAGARMSSSLVQGDV